MKGMKYIVAGCLVAASLVVQAGPKTQDFNSLIDQNNQVQKDLEKDLQEQLKTRRLVQHKKQYFKVMGEEVVGQASSENVAVDSKKFKDRVSKTASHKELEKKNFNRLSAEMKDLKNSSFEQ